MNYAYSTTLNEDEVEFYITFFNLVWEYMCIDSKFCSNENTTKYFNSYFAYNDFDKMSLAINVIYIKDVNKFKAYSWNFFDSIISKLESKKNTNYMKTLMLMYDKTTEKKGLSLTQKSELIDSLILLYIHWNSFENTRLIIKDWLIKVENKDSTLFKSSIEDLSYLDLEVYVYNIHNLDNDTLHANSFDLYLSQISEYSKFIKFINHLYKNHRASIQLTTLQNYFNSCNVSYFDWLFSGKKYVHKQVLNDLIKKYLNRYENDKKTNTIYLKNLLKLEKNEVYASTKKVVSEFLEILYRPTILHKTKISSLKRKLRL